MKKVRIKTEKVTVPSWKANLYISLFNRDGGDGFSDEEIKEAEVFLKENNYRSLVEVSESVDAETECVFLIGYW